MTDDELGLLRQRLEAARELCLDLRAYTHDWDWKYGEGWDAELDRIWSGTVQDAKGVVHLLHVGTTACGLAPKGIGWGDCDAWAPLRDWPPRTVLPLCRRCAELVEVLQLR